MRAYNTPLFQTGYIHTHGIRDLVSRQSINVAKGRIRYKERRMCSTRYTLFIDTRIGAYSCCYSGEW